MHQRVQVQATLQPPAADEGSHERSLRQAVPLYQGPEPLCQPVQLLGGQQALAGARPQPLPLRWGVSVPKLPQVGTVQPGEACCNLEAGGVLCGPGEYPARCQEVGPSAAACPARSATTCPCSSVLEVGTIQTGPSALQPGSHKSLPGRKASRSLAGQVSLILIALQNLRGSC